MGGLSIAEPRYDGRNEREDEQRKQSHETILESAARLLRMRGISGARVAEVMKGAGLTVGGFYAHFASKEALIDDAFRRASAQSRERLFDRIDEKPAEARLEVLIKRYLSPRHRDDFERGCALPATVTEIATTATEHQGVLKEHLDALALGLERYLPARKSLSKRHVALGLAALMYGGLSLSRALRGTPMSDEFLKACRAFGAFVGQELDVAPPATPAKATSELEFSSKGQLS